MLCIKTSSNQKRNLFDSKHIQINRRQEIGMVQWSSTYEDQEVSRKRKREDDGHDELQQMRLFYECREKARLIERLIMKRVLPSPYCKHVGKKERMYVTEMDETLWEYFITNNPVAPTMESKYAHSYPDHGWTRREYFHRVGWENGEDERVCVKE